MTGSALEVRRTLDLSRAPDEQWNEEMVRMISAQLFRGRQVTKGELYYSLAVADGVGLNPLVGEIYFIPSKSRDAKGPTYTPYIGRNGLVKKATERRAYFESDTVHENDRFRIVRKADGTRTCTHSYSHEDRGEIVAAYAFLHDDDGRRKPAFFYAELDQYLPTFDADWKMDASAWGNQRSGMIEKCAMIGAGRKRLDLGNVLIDGEIARYEQQGSLGPAPVEPAEFDWSQLGDSDAAARLRAAVDRVNEFAPLSWPPAKLEMIAAGLDETELGELAARVEGEADSVAEGTQGSAPDASSESAGDSSEEPGEPAEVVTDAQVVTDAEHRAGLEKRLAELEADAGTVATDSDAYGQIGEEITKVQGELAALDNPDQGSLLDGDGGG